MKLPLPSFRTPRAATRADGLPAAGASRRLPEPAASTFVAPDPASSDGPAPAARRPDDERAAPAARRPDDERAAPADGSLPPSPPVAPPPLTAPTAASSATADGEPARQPQPEVTPEQAVRPEPPAASGSPAPGSPASGSRPVAGNGASAPRNTGGGRDLPARSGKGDGRGGRSGSASRSGTSAASGRGPTTGASAAGTSGGSVSPGGTSKPAATGTPPTSRADTTRGAKSRREQPPPAEPASRLTIDEAELAEALARLDVPVARPIGVATHPSLREAAVDAELRPVPAREEPVPRRAGAAPAPPASPAAPSEPARPTEHGGNGSAAVSVIEEPLFIDVADVAGAHEPDVTTDTAEAALVPVANAAPAPSASPPPAPIAQSASPAPAAIAATTAPAATAPRPAPAAIAAARPASAPAPVTSAGPPLISLRDVSRRYGGASEVAALEHTSLDIRAGEFVCVLGASGSGKTTLLNLIGALDQPSSGEIRIAGRKISGASASDLAKYRRESVSFIFQTFNLFPALTAIENVEFGANVARRRNASQAAVEMLNRVGLGHRLRHFPHALSGGEQQRVAIARALATGNPIVLADEPTGELDFRTGLQILELLQSQAGTGRVVIVVTHNREIARVADRVIELSSGHVIADRRVEGARPALTDLHW